MFGHNHKEQLRLLKRNGENSSMFKALFTSQNGHKIFTIHQDQLPPNWKPDNGDILQRKISESENEDYLIIDRGYCPKGHLAPERFICRVSDMKSLIDSHPNITYNLLGNNSRININSTDQSSNFIIEGAYKELFENLKNVISTSGLDTNEKITNSVVMMEKSVGKREFVHAYRDFVSASADHMTILSPFIIPLTDILSNCMAQ